MTKSKQDKLRVALIGAGGIAGAHMRYYQDMDDVEMVAAADVALERAQKSCEEYEIPAAFADYEEMLRQVAPDAVSVCTPNGLHAPCSIAALDAGAHVLVEKPLAMNAREGQQMLDAAERNGKKLIIGFQNRYDPKTQFIKKLVDDGELGAVLYARVQSLRRRGIPNWGGLWPQGPTRRWAADRHRRPHARGHALCDGRTPTGGSLWQHLYLHRRQAVKRGLGLAQLGL